MSVSAAANVCPQDPLNRPLDEDGELQEDWRKLFERYPDRFILGADEFISMDISQKAKPASTQGTWDLIAQLPDELALAFAGDNPGRIFGLE